MINWKTLEKTNVPAVDFCIDEVYKCRTAGTALKAIYLWPSYYGKFKKWVADTKKADIIICQNTLEKNTHLTSTEREKMQAYIDALRAQLDNLDSIKFELDGVEIALGTVSQSKPLLCELWAV